MKRPEKVRRSHLPQLEQLEDRHVLTAVQPTAMEQLFLERLNDIRANPKAYGDRIGVDLSSIAPAQPLAFNGQLIQVARQHSQDMNARGYFNQVTQDGKDPGHRLIDAGVNWISWGESIAAGNTDTDVDTTLKALITNADKPTHPDRDQLLSVTTLLRTQNQVGIGIVQNGGGPLSNYYTIDAIQGNDGRPFVTGVVYIDANHNGVYDIGEGLSGIQVSVQNGPSTTTFDTGGYSLQLNPGTYTLSIQGGRLAAPISQSISVSNASIRFNFVLNTNQVQSGNDGWVALLYRDVLGRAPTTDEVHGWTSAIDGGATRDQVAAAFVGSAEYQQHLVTQWFAQYLGRTPDPTGLSTFASTLSSNANQEVARFGILASTEYYANHGSDPTKFVQALYQDLLGRAPQGNEAAGWVSQVSNGRGAVVNGFLGSQEFKIDETERLYDSLLRRAADGDGLNHFVNLLAHGQDLRAAQREILMSTEYYNSAQKVLWIQSLYNTVLGRSGDGAAELGSWLAALNGGMDRSAIAAAFTGSAENQIHIVRGLYQRLLGRDADQGGLLYFVSLLRQHGQINEVIAGITGSDEYFVRNQSTSALFVLALYRDFLNRGAANAELQGWVAKIDAGQTRQQVSQAFLSSQEPQTFYINSLYQNLLGRAPNSVELSSMLSRLQNGEADATIQATLLGSDEFFEKSMRS